MNEKELTYEYLKGISNTLTEMVEQIDGLASVIYDSIMVDEEEDVEE